MMIGKIKSIISTLRGDVINFTPFKGFMIAINGNGASNPTIQTSYNTVSTVRIGVGVYQVTLIQNTILGASLNDSAIILNSHTIQPSAVSEAHFVRLDSISPGVLNIVVTEMTVGAGNKLEVNPYDILAGDGIDITAFLNLGIGKLPPE